jgi:mRNA interferase RelE/StbE
MATPRRATVYLDEARRSSKTSGLASYRLLIKPSAVKDVEKLPLRDRRRIVKRMRALADDPRPAGSEKLKGIALYRVRQGDYRIPYEVSDAAATITVVSVDGDAPSS